MVCVCMVHLSVTMAHVFINEIDVYEGKYSRTKKLWRKVEWRVITRFCCLRFTLLVEIFLGVQVCDICTVGFEIGKRNNNTVKCNLHNYTMSECQGVQHTWCYVISYLRRVTGPPVGGFFVLIIIPFRQRMQWIISGSIPWPIPCPLFIVHNSSYAATYFHHHVHRDCPGPSKCHFRLPHFFPQIQVLFYFNKYI